MAVRVTRTSVITGGAGLMRMARLGAGEGVMSPPSAVNVAVMVIVPATVPVCMAGLGTGKVARFAPAGMVKVTTVPPVENCTAGSPAPASGVNVSVRRPEMGTG